ncbi:hypothetical protein D9M73_186040 [compost metagenome]
MHEEGFIQHQVAGDLGDTVGTQVAHQQPEFFHVQLRIAATLEVEVAIEDAATEGAVGVELGFPLVGGAEHFQCRVGGDQLHGRGRVDRDVGVEHGGRARAVERQHDQRQGRVLQFVGFQCLLHFWRKRGVDRSRVAGKRQRHQQAGKQKRAKRSDHVR